MKIVLSGVETNNKGAELMLYAILQEIERKYPKAEVYLDADTIPQGLDYVHTNVNLRLWPLGGFVRKFHLNGILSLLHLPLIHDRRAVNADYFLDGSGFCFSDQCGMWGRKSDWWEIILRRQKKHGAKIVFLPQAFGPLEKEDTKAAISVLNKYATCIMPREKVSYDYLEKSGLVDMHKVMTFTDFTSLVEGVFPEKYEHLKNGICVIPNMKMIDKGKISMDGYISHLSAIVEEGRRSGHPVYLLNHEGNKDEWLANECKRSLDDSVEVVSKINALEVKGLIATAYLVITSRFHGLASSLNSCVPSLATSWSHKYEELFRDYGLEGYVLPLNDIEKAVERVGELLDEQENQRLRNHLAQQIPLIKAQTKEMWECVWALNQ